jgi:Barrel-sandwich domain of CusB or HlyD membrane-fusion
MIYMNETKKIILKNSNKKNYYKPGLLLLLFFLAVLLFACKSSKLKTIDFDDPPAEAPRLTYIMGGDIESNEFNGLYINAFIPENMLRLVQTGMKVKIKVSGLEAKIFNGEISSINPDIDSKSKTSMIEIKILDSSSALRPGMLVMVGYETKSGG